MHEMCQKMILYISEFIMFVIQINSFYFFFENYINVFFIWFNAQRAAFSVIEVC